MNRKYFSLPKTATLEKTTFMLKILQHALECSKGDWFLTPGSCQSHAATASRSGSRLSPGHLAFEPWSKCQTAAECCSTYQQSQPMEMTKP